MSLYVWIIRTICRIFYGIRSLNFPTNKCQYSCLINWICSLEVRWTTGNQFTCQNFERRLAVWLIGGAINSKFYCQIHLKSSGIDVRISVCVSLSLSTAGSGCVLFARACKYIRYSLYVSSPLMPKTYTLHLEGWHNIFLKYVIVLRRRDNGAHYVELFASLETVAEKLGQYYY